MVFWKNFETRANRTQGRTKMKTRRNPTSTEYSFTLFSISAWFSMAVCVCVCVHVCVCACVRVCVCVCMCVYK